MLKYYYFIDFFLDLDMGTFDLAHLSREQVETVEADSFWCVSALLDTIQDNYTFAQPGIQRKVNHLKELISRVERNCFNGFMFCWDSTLVLWVISPL